MSSTPADAGHRDRQSARAGRIRLGREGGWAPGRGSESFPEPLAGLYRDATASTSGRLEAAASEYEALDASQDQVRALSVVPIRGIPLIARRHGVAQPVPGIADEVNWRYEQTWQLLQAELASRSDRAR